MAGIFQFFTSLLKKIVGFAEWLLLLVKQLFIDAWNVVTDVFCWLLDGFLSIAVSALQAISVPFDPQTYYSMIPPEVAIMLGYIGVPQALSMIVAALVIRFTLQTIPFVRWGS